MEHDELDDLELDTDWSVPDQPASAAAGGPRTHSFLAPHRQASQPRLAAALPHASQQGLFHSSQHPTASQAQLANSARPQCTRPPQASLRNDEFFTEARPKKRLLLSQNTHGLLHQQQAAASQQHGAQPQPAPASMPAPLFPTQRSNLSQAQPMLTARPAQQRPQAAPARQQPPSFPLHTVCSSSQPAQQHPSSLPSTAMVRSRPDRPALRTLPGPAGLLQQAQAQGHPISQLSDLTGSTANTSQRRQAGRFGVLDPDFMSEAWQSALAALDLATFDETSPLLRHTVRSTLQGDAPARIAKLTVLVANLTQSALGDAFMQVKDPSGVIGAGVQRSLLEAEPDIAPGAVLVLHKVAVLQVGPRTRCLCITSDNVLQVTPAAKPRSALSALSTALQAASSGPAWQVSNTATGSQQQQQQQAGRPASACGPMPASCSTLSALRPSFPTASLDTRGTCWPASSSDQPTRPWAAPLHERSGLAPQRAGSGLDVQRVHLHSRLPAAPQDSQQLAEQADEEFDDLLAGLDDDPATWPT